MNAKEENGNAVLQPFEKWLSERHKWLQTAAVWMIENRTRPNEKVIRHFADLCLLEATKVESKDFRKITPGSLEQAAMRPQLSLVELADVSGVNAIKTGAKLTFGKTGLTVVYGSNGSGKSGYARLLKQICGSRAKEDLLKNVFDKKAGEPTAKVLIEKGGESIQLDWILENGGLADLRHVHVFDAATAALYFGPKNEATYEPSRMRFVSSLIRLSDEVAEELNSRKERLISKLPIMSPALAGTPSAQWLNAMKLTTTQAEVDIACQYTEELDAERVSAEGALAEKDIPGRLKVLDQELLAVNNVKSLFETWKNGLDDTKVEAIIAARVDAAQKRKLANQDAEKVFADASLEGVGNDAWRALWNKAREFSEAHAYAGLVYPHVEEDAKCVLCQQPLENDAKNRMRQFETFVRGALERDALASEQTLKVLLNALPVIPSVETWLVSAGILKFEEEKAQAWLSSLQSRRTALDTEDKKEAVGSVEWEIVGALITTSIQTKNQEKTSLEELQKDGTRQKKAARVLELSALQWLSQQKNAILEELQRRKDVAAFVNAGSLTSTALLTKKNTELSVKELSEGYQARFELELKALNGTRLPVMPKSRQLGKGKVTFNLIVKDADEGIKAESILSEGERRIIALAAFLADISGSEQSTPFIFDDPISSLDQDFEEHVVERLVSLAQQRQVIIFTHRLSLLVLVETIVKKLADQAKLQQVVAPVTLHTSSLRRMGRTVGLVSDMSVRDAKPEKALNKLLLESIPQLRKLMDDSDVGGFDEKAKSICSDFRILVERCVEIVLLNEVVVRFRRSITTQGRIASLARIRVDDCAMIDALMSRYSVYEHSQSEELPAQQVDIDQLEEDVAKLSGWVKEFLARPTVSS
ncbi:AAA family ATPase [Herminiimonas glaciei]|uniref:AAA family ATPase n=1 Tax=Herminiimonas glaciei TaxID=523788 RepID=A0ABW2I5Z4_9BURK|nr:AAA family ATPase [Herminiimonas sp. KBW02]